MAQSGLRIALLGATGAVGTEILAQLEERNFPVGSLRAFASEASEGAEVELRGEPIRVETLTTPALLDSDLILCAAPGALRGRLEEIARKRTFLVDVSGALELDPEVPLHLPGCLPRGANEEDTRWLAIPRGVVAGLGITLSPLSQQLGLERVTVLTLESASGAGRAGVGELADQTTELLNAMTGEAGEPGVFPRALAFDCLPWVGERIEGEESSEERRLRHVLRRLLAAPGLPIEVTRVRVPIFGGSLACVHVELSGELGLDGARALWEKHPGVEVLDEKKWPTPRDSMGTDVIRLGRIRADEGGRKLAFVLSLDDLRRGSALAAVAAAEALFRLS